MGFNGKLMMIICILIIIASYGISQTIENYDVDNNWRIDFVDLQLVASYFGKANMIYDVNRDSFINILDLILVAKNINKLQQAQTPTITPAGGQFNNPITVSITSSDPQAIIYYTINLSDPTQGSKIYNGTMTISSATTLRARAYVAGMSASNITSAAFQIFSGNGPSIGAINLQSPSTIGV
jgi:hypothetical protein